MLGSLFEDKALNASSYWPNCSASGFRMSIPDLTVFKFPAGSMTSTYVASSEIKYSFLKDNVVIPTAQLASAGLSEFCLRAYVNPTSDSYAKVSLSLYPMSEVTLTSNPLFLDPAFPGLTFKVYQFPLSPKPLYSPIRRYWGFPLVPCFFPGSSWSDAPGLPSGAACRLALSTLLRSSVAPDSTSRPLYLQEKIALLREDPSSLATLLPPSIVWPVPAISAPVPEGWCFSFSYLFYLVPSQFSLGSFLCCYFLFSFKSGLLLSPSSFTFCAFNFVCFLSFSLFSFYHFFLLVYFLFTIPFFPQSWDGLFLLVQLYLFLFLFCALLNPSATQSQEDTASLCSPKRTSSLCSPKRISSLYSPKRTSLLYGPRRTFSLASPKRTFHFSVPNGPSAHKSPLMTSAPEDFVHFSPFH